MSIHFRQEAGNVLAKRYGNQTIICYSRSKILKDLLSLNVLLILMIALTWPRMRQFHLGSDIGWERTRVTLDGLIPFTKCWPALDSLAISLQADTNVSAVQRPAGRSCCPNLKTLQVAGGMDRSTGFIGHICRCTKAGKGHGKLRCFSSMATWLWERNPQERFKYDGASFSI